MYPSKPGLIIGFHGCDETVTHKIINHKDSIKSKKNKYDWLGHGIYFWENNRKRAMDFAHELKENPRLGRDPISKPSVIGAVIDLGFCLDLMDTEYIKFVNTSYKNLVESSKTLGLEIPRNKSVNGSHNLLLRNLDCAVIENLHEQRESNKLKPFDSVRGVFVEGKRIYPTAGFNHKTHIKICIRNPNCIKGFFLPNRLNNNFSIP